MNDMTPADEAGLGPKVKSLVMELREEGFNTVESGDGTNYRNGMEAAQPYRHVYIHVSPAMSDEALGSLRAFIAERFDASEWSVGAFDPGPHGVDYLYVRDANWEEVSVDWPKDAGVGREDSTTTLMERCCVAIESSDGFEKPVHVPLEKATGAERLAVQKTLSDRGWDVYLKNDRVEIGYGGRQ